MYQLLKTLKCWGEFILIFSFILLLSFSHVQSQYKYRTFSQSDLSEKKAKAGKVLGSEVCFVFHNTLADTVNGLSARLNSAISSIKDSGGFPIIAISGKSKVLTLKGYSVLPGDSVIICIRVAKKASGTKVNFWWWMKENEQVGPRMDSLNPSIDTRLMIQPNGGNVLEYLYKKVIQRPEGVLVGKSDSITHGWIRYMKADRKYFIHSGAPRCFDYIVTGSGGQRAFLGQLRNPHVKKHDNHLLGEVHALKLAVIANDFGVTEPWDTSATLIGDLIYNDTVNTDDPCNGLTIRQIISLTDSALTYCDKFSSNQYIALDNCISRINSEFIGPYVADSVNPLRIRGTKDLIDVYYLHLNPLASKSKNQRYNYGEILQESDVFETVQNYPNPFNPSTTIEFTLVKPSIVTLKIYNLLGQEVTTLLHQQAFDDGDISVEWDASRYPSGIYFYRISIQEIGKEKNVYNVVRKMILAK